jgi:hypothetical protein
MDLMKKSTSLMFARSSRLSLMLLLSVESNESSFQTQFHV